MRALAWLQVYSCSFVAVFLFSRPLACSGVLVQPQWKHFKHFDMMKNDQIRLSNGIWRSWHIKCNSPFFPSLPLLPPFLPSSHLDRKSVV